MERSHTARRRTKTEGRRSDEGEVGGRPRRRSRPNRTRWVFAGSSRRAIGARVGARVVSSSSRTSRTFERTVLLADVAVEYTTNCFTMSGTSFAPAIAAASPSWRSGEKVSSRRLVGTLPSSLPPRGVVRPAVMKGCVVRARSVPARASSGVRKRARASAGRPRAPGPRPVARGARSNPRPTDCPYATRNRCAGWRLRRSDDARDENQRASAPISSFFAPGIGTRPRGGGAVRHHRRRARPGHPASRSSPGPPQRSPRSPTDATMNANRSFVKKTKGGRVMKVVREHYLDDIFVGWARRPRASRPRPVVVEAQPERGQVRFDTNVALHQLDLLAHAAVTDAVVLSVVLEGVAPGARRATTASARCARIPPSASSSPTSTTGHLRQG